MFTQRLSMDCTKEQYEKYLKDELLKMGYNDDYATFRECEEIIVNNGGGYMWILGSLFSESKLYCDRTYLGSFNPELFLALAAMTDSHFASYGEYYTDGKYWLKAPIRATNTEFIGKATKEEIIERFDNNKMPMWESCSNIIKNLEEIYTAIKLLKSNGYKIMRKTETWEEV